MVCCLFAVLVHHMSSSLFLTLYRFSAVENVQVPLSVDNWVTVLTWALPILLVEEVLKAVGRYIYRDEKSGQMAQSRKWT
jgi:hypothetical protein